MRIRDTGKQAALATSTVAWLLLASGCATAPPLPRGPVIDSVAIGTIDWQPVPIAGLAAERTWLGELLSRQAAAAAGRAAVAHALAGRVASRPGGDVHVLTGQISLPAAMPEGIRGSRADFQPGLLGSASLRLVDEKGDEVAVASIDLTWKDGRWTTGGPKNRRARPTDLVLIEAAGAAVERAVGELARQLRDSTGAAKQPGTP